MNIQFSFPTITKKQLINASWTLIRAVLIVGISYIILFPVLSKISSSLMMERDLYDQTVMWIPRHFTIENYLLVWENMKYPVAFMNSLLLTITTSILQVVSCTLIGYGLARFDFRGKRLIFGLVLIMLLVPPQVIMIPLYMNFRFFDLFGLLPEGGINLIGTYFPFVLLSITGTNLKNGLFIYVMRQFFKGMPRTLEEAAHVDGAGQLRTFFSVMLPGATPALVVVFLFAFVWQWNDYYLVRMFLGDATLLANTLSRLSVSVIQEGGGVEDITYQYMSLLNNTGSLLFIAPLLILFIFMQRYFIESIERTGIVG